MNYFKDRDKWAKEYIITALKQNNYHVDDTAKAIGMDRTSLYKFIKRYSITIKKNNAIGPKKDKGACCFKSCNNKGRKQISGRLLCGPHYNIIAREKVNAT